MLKEINTCILLIIDQYGVEGVILNEIFTFVVFCCGHKAAEVRNECIAIIKTLYRHFGEQILTYLDPVKPSTMSVISQELSGIVLPEHLRAPAPAPAEPEEDLLVSPEKPWDSDGLKAARSEAASECESAYI